MQRRRRDVALVPGRLSAVPHTTPTRNRHPGGALSFPPPAHDHNRPRWLRAVSSAPACTDRELAMGSFTHPRVFNPLDLEIMDRVYEAAWAQVEARDPTRDTANDGIRQDAL